MISVESCHRVIEGSHQEGREESSDESSVEDGEESNLQFLATMMDSACGVNGEISTLMSSLIKCRFLIGPSPHGYYDGNSVKARKYENEWLELIHPDIRPGYKPNENAGSMRKF